MKRFLTLFFCAALAAPAAFAAAPDFSKALRSARGSLISSKGEVAALFANADGKTARLEIWGQREGGWERLASAPKAGCLGCAGASRKDEWMPLSLHISQGELWADYAGGAGQESWAWRTQWVWDFILQAPRARAAQRLGFSDDGAERLVLADFISGAQSQRSAAIPAELGCRMPSFSAPEFEQLSLKSLFEGVFEPGCVQGTEKGNPLAAAPRIKAPFAEDVLGARRSALD